MKKSTNLPPGFDQLSAYHSYLMKKAESKNEQEALSVYLQSIEKKLNAIAIFQAEQFNIFRLVILDTKSIAHLCRVSTATVSRWFAAGLTNLDEGGKTSRTSLAKLMDFLRDHKPKSELDLDELSDILYKR